MVYHKCCIKLSDEDKAKLLSGHGVRITHRHMGGHGHCHITSRQVKAIRACTKLGHLLKFSDPQKKKNIKEGSGFKEIWASIKKHAKNGYKQSKQFLDENPEIKEIGKKIGKKLIKKGVEKLGLGVKKRKQDGKGWLDDLISPFTSVANSLLKPVSDIVRSNPRLVRML